MERTNQYGDTNLKEVLEWLKDEDFTEHILGDYEKLYHLLYFFHKNNVASSYGEIEKLSAEHFSIVFKNICLLFPLSEYLLEQIMEKYSDEENNKEEIYGDFLDVAGKSLLASLNRIINLWNNADENRRLKIYKKRIAEYEKIKLDKQKIYDDLKAKGSEEKELANEVANLEQQTIELKKSYTKEALDAKKKELEETQTKLENNKKEYEETQAEIDKIIAEAKEYENWQQTSDNLKKLTDKLPNNEDN